ASRLPDLVAFKAQLYAGVKRTDENFDERRAEILSFFTDLIAERRAEGAGDDTISELLRATVDGRPWTDEEIVNAGVVLMLASLDTTTSALGLILGHLAERPDLRQRLVDAPGMIPTAVEEFLRYEHLLHNGRVLTADTEIGGVPLREGDRI